MNKNNFTWVDTYKEIANWLATKEDSQEELIQILQRVGVNNFNDKDYDGSTIPLTEIDPFTFLSYLNKYGDDKRCQILSKLHTDLKIKASQPTDVNGLPTINAMKVWLFGYKYSRKGDDIKLLWKLFRQAVSKKIDEKTFNDVLNIKCVGKGKLSICLFYCDPEYYLPLDSRTSMYLKNQNLRYTYNTYKDYRGLIDGAIQKLDISRCEISKKALDNYQSQRGNSKKLKISQNKDSEEIFSEELQMNDLSDLINFIADVQDKSDFEGDVFYRGHADSIVFKLQPSLYRNKHHVEKEDIMHKELIGCMPSEFQSCASTFERLVKMQHYGLPTRLLDITSNPLVALYFACCNLDDKDGALYRFEVGSDLIKYYDSDTVSVIANIARRPVGFSISNIRPKTSTPEHKIKQRDEFNDAEVIVYLLHEIGSEKPHFKAVIDPCDIERTICVKPKLDNPRIIRQDGAFFLFGIDGDKTKHAKPPKPTHVFIIPKNSKRLIKSQLQALGINEFSLFPDIDHSAKHIKDKFSESKAMPFKI